jgi:shikimate 5-dehydrogenase
MCRSRSPDDLESALRIGAARLSGCNLTIPHKERALALVDTVDPEPAALAR